MRKREPRLSILNCLIVAIVFGPGFAILGGILGLLAAVIVRH